MMQDFIIYMWWMNNLSSNITCVLSYLSIVPHLVSKLWVLHDKKVYCDSFCIIYYL